MGRGVAWAAGEHTPGRGLEKLQGVCNGHACFYYDHMGYASIESAGDAVALSAVACFQEVWVHLGCACCQQVRLSLLDDPVRGKHRLLLQR